MLDLSRFTEFIRHNLHSLQTCWQMEKTFWHLCIRVPVVTLVQFYVLINGHSSRVLVDEIHVGSSSGPDDVHGALVKEHVLILQKSQAH